MLVIIGDICIEIYTNVQIDPSLLSSPFLLPRKIHPALSCTTAVQGETMSVMIGDVCIEAIKNIRGPTVRIAGFYTIAKVGPALL